MAKRLLIVDDDQQMRQLIRSLLDRLEVDFREARDGLEALEVHRVFRPDVIIMDIEMSPVDGLSAMRLIRERDRSVLVIVVSQYDSRQLRTAARMAGASAYLPKENLPDLERLIRRIADVPPDS
jgi:CheY-like chemotaxis protein